jgi:nitrogen fixation protein FixH
MMLRSFFVAVVLVAGIVPAFAVQNPGVVAVNHTYEARIRFNGKVSTTQVQASDAGQAKKLVQQQFPGATVLSVKKVD